MYKLILFFSLLALCGQSCAFWRMLCKGITGVARIDPLVTPGQIGDHPHIVFGGSNFAYDATSEDLMDSNCTSCAVTEDKSAYWIPPLFFVHENGTTEMAKQRGGLIAYYELNHGLKGPEHGDKIKAFPKNFRMLAGDTRRRNFTNFKSDVKDFNSAEGLVYDGEPDLNQLALAQKSIGFNCLNYDGDAEPTVFRNFLPEKSFIDARCPDGIRLEMFFPSCWNEELDSPDHKSHMAYPSKVNDGECPKGFKTRVPTLLYEVIFDTAPFKDSDGMFVLGNGDPTGYGLHADFITGWDEDFLQKAIDTCDSGMSKTNGNLRDCEMFLPYLQGDDVSRQCRFEMPEELADDDCLGPRDGLCGDVPVQHGPGYAAKLTPGLKVQPSIASSASKIPTASTEDLSLAPTTEMAPPPPTTTESIYGYTSGDVTIARHAVATGMDAEPSAADVESSSVGAATTDMDAATATEDGPVATPMTTIYSTSGNAVYQLKIDQIDVTVTAERAAEETAPAKQRRRHVHHRRGHRHGHLF